MLYTHLNKRFEHPCANFAADMTPRAQILSEVHRWEMDGVTEVLGIADALSDAADKADAKRSGDASQMGTREFPEAYELATRGWPEGLGYANALSAQLASSVTGSRRMAPKLTRCQAGFAPCVPAMLAGEPESMFAIRQEMREGCGRVVRVVYNQCSSWGISGETLLKRGAIVAALVDVLEGAGVRCEVVACTGLRKGSQAHEFFVPLKSAGDPLDMDALIFWLAHAAAYRRMFWSLWSALASPAMGGVNPHGMPMEVCPEMQGDLYLGAAHLEHVNDATAADFVKRQAMKFGVQFEGAEVAQ